MVTGHGCTVMPHGLWSKIGSKITNQVEVFGIE